MARNPRCLDILSAIGELVVLCELLETTQILACLLFLHRMHNRPRVDARRSKLHSQCRRILERR